MHALLRLPLSLAAGTARRGFSVATTPVRLAHGLLAGERPAPPQRAAAVPAAPPAHVDRDAGLVASYGPAADVGPSVDVAPPWAGYDSQPAPEVVRRLRSADAALKALAALYERRHRGRRSVLDAATGPAAGS